MRHRAPLSDDATRAPLGRVARSAALTLVLAGLTVLVVLVETGALGVDPQLGVHGAVTLAVFGAAIGLWTLSTVDDTWIALGAVAALYVAGVLDSDTLDESLGNDVVWLLLAAFVLAAAVERSGLATRATLALATRASTPRRLVHLLTVGLVATAFAVPATAGRAALALPVFLVLARTLDDRPRIVRTIALLIPTVVLLSAFASLLGAGAHLVTEQLLDRTVDVDIGFARWALIGLPLALAASHLSAEVVLLTTTDRRERARRLEVRSDVDRDTGPTPTGDRAQGQRSGEQLRIAALLVAVVVLWSTEGVTGLDTTLIALGGALLATAPRVGVVGFADGLARVPWNLLLFLAATLALGRALERSGAAAYLARGALTGAAVGGTGFLVVVVVVSTVLHLAVPSRTARSTVLVPVVIAVAPALGADPVIAAVASTAAAGFCHTLPASAKPVAIFSEVTDPTSGHAVPTWGPRDLLRLSVVLGPLHATLVTAFALWVWPWLLGR